MKTKILSYVLIAFALFIIYQQVHIWIEGIGSSPLVSVFRYDPPLKKLRELKLKKGEEKQPVKGTINVIVPKTVNAQDAVDKAQPGTLFTIGRWEVDEICRKGGVLEIKWDPTTGDTSASYDAPPTRTFELGRLRELGVWVGLAYSTEGLKSPAIDLEYRHDLFRVGPMWTAFRAGLHYREIQYNGLDKKGDFSATVQLGIPLVRF